MKEWRVYAKPKPGQTPGIIITFPEWDEPGAREWFKEHQTTKPGHFYEGMTLELVEYETREERIEKALAFYANPKNWDQYGVIHNDPKDCSCGLKHHHPDCGYVAREALKQ